MFEKFVNFFWADKAGFLLGCIINVGAIYYMGANIVWSSYGHADITPLHLPILILSLIHSVYVTPFGLWSNFIKQNIKTEKREKVSVTLCIIYYALWYILHYHSGLLEALS
jgi:hypothetical protein